MADLVTLGQRIRHFRTAADLTLGDLGDAIGVSASQLSLLENGKREPRLSMLTALVLPPQAAGALLSRELVYTGITRARDAFTLVAAQPAVLEQALRQRTQRSSGLPARLQA